MDKILSNARTVEEMLVDIVEPLIGDTPISVQLSTALNGMASKEDVLALRKDVNKLCREVEKLMELVGDIPVSAQINIAMNRSEN